MALHSWPLTSDIVCLQGRICSSGCCRRPRDAHNLMCLYERSAWSWCGSRARQVQSSAHSPSCKMSLTTQCIACADVLHCCSCIVVTLSAGSKKLIYKKCHLLCRWLCVRQHLWGPWRA